MFKKTSMKNCHHFPPVMCPFQNAQREQGTATKSKLVSATKNYYNLLKQPRINK